MPPICSRTWCRRELLQNSQFKTCEPCRESNNKDKRATRQRSRDAKKLEEAHKENKRLRGSNESDRCTSKRNGLRNIDLDDGSSDDGTDNTVQMFENPEDFFEEIHTLFRANSAVHFLGAYTTTFDPMISFRELVQMVSQEIWKITGYSVKDHRQLKSGHKTRYWCSQDLDRKKKSKRSIDPEMKNRDTVGMQRFTCHSRLVITCQEINDLVRITTRLEHSTKHVIYTDVSMPEGALTIVRENVEWLTPVAMVSKVQAAFPEVTAAQIHMAWTQMSQLYWQRDESQLTSASKLLTEYPDEVDVFSPIEVLEGVEMLCWGMKKIAQPLDGRVFEVGLDATCKLITLRKTQSTYTIADNTNSKHLELYSMMAEFDNAGFPLSYCLLSTASAIDQGKRTKALTAWIKCIRATYGIEPIFVHVDKDMAEIAAARQVWNPAKISICYGHLRQAVRTKMANTKLATSPYDAKRAHAEFDLIDVNFGPRGHVDDTSGNPSAPPY
ncbi:hypothetical protein H0H92_005025 [Tricholoma furcatifolium]|nr:hypothetical protein H0H92_005025 [Tricholoma furcatifolium]